MFVKTATMDDKTASLFNKTATMINVLVTVKSDALGNAASKSPCCDRFGQCFPDMSQFSWGCSKYWELKRRKSIVGGKNRRNFASEKTEIK